MSDSLVALAVAFAVAWLLIGVYVIRLARAQQKIAKRLDELRPNSPRPSDGAS